MSDSLSSTTVVVNSLGVVAAQRFAPDGQARWAGGTMPTSSAFTGQRTDSTTGLDYDAARYYDPAAGTFISADTMLPGKGFSPAGLNRYAYVSGNPETLTDQTGHMMNRPCFDREECAPIKVGVGSSLQDQCVGSTVICNQIIKQYGDQRTVLTLFSIPIFHMSA